MNFKLSDIQALIDIALRDQPTGISFLDERYDWYTRLVGHTNPYYRLFYLIAQELKPQLVVELGSYRATAAAHFALGNPEGQVITIDWHKDAQQVDDKAMCIETCNQIDNLRYINKASWDAAEDVRALNQTIDILFIDAWHTEEYVKREQALYFPLLDSPALVIADDLFNNAGMFAGMEEWWADMPGAKIINSQMHPNIPMGFMRYETEPTVAANPTRKKRKAANRPE